MPIVNVRKNLIGMKFGRLTVLEQAEDYIKPSGKHEAQWLCQCDCGGFNITSGDHLKSGHTQSCGCFQKEAMIKSGLKTNNLIFNTKKYNTYDLTGDYGIGYTAKGEEFYFDLEDYDKIKDYCWHINNDGYVICADGRLYLHILIMSPSDNEFVDHIKHKKFDNRKSELRYVNASQSAINRGMQSNNTSGITGVSFHKKSKKWFAYIKLNGKQKRIYAKSKNEAIIFRKELEDEYFGKYSYANSMKGGTI